MKIVTYETLEMETLFELNEQVRFYITRGWQPLGGSYHHSKGPGHMDNYGQAMVKYED